MSKFKIGDIVTCGFKWKIKDVKSLGDYDLYEIKGIDGYWLENELKLVKEEQDLTQQNTFKIKDIIDKLNIKKGKYVSDNGVEIEITEDTVILGNKHNKEFVIPIDFDDTFKEDRKLTLDDFDLEEEFKVLDLEGIFKKVKIFDSILVARKWNDGSVWTYRPSGYSGEDHKLIKINK